MRRALVRSLLASLVVAVALMGPAGSPSSAQSDPTTTTTVATGAPDTPSGDPAIDDLVGCVQGSRRLLVLFLIDESASLKVTDPENRRVDAAHGALDSLVALSTSQGAASPKVDVALAAFSNEYRLVQDWTAAGNDTAGELDRSLQKFKSFNKGIDTDFVHALSSGRNALADRSAAVSADGTTTPCRAVMLFTDGGYDIAQRSTPEERERLGLTKDYAPGVELTSKENVIEAERLGREALCKPGGLADRLRRDNVTLLTVALSGSVARRSQLPLAAATTGKADDYPCGTQPAKGQATRVQGAYLPAEDIDLLVTQFNGVGTRLAGGNLVPGSDKVEVCGKDPCDEGTRSFKLDKSLRRAQILALPPKAGADVVLEGPDGDTATISEAGTSKVGDTSVRTRVVAGRGLVIDLTRPDDLASWTGDWKASIVDPSEEQQGKAATLQIFVFSDLGVAFGDMRSLERGKPTEIKAELKLPKGVKAADVVASVTAKARLRNPVTGAIDTIDLKGPPQGPYTGTYDTPATTTANAMDVVAELRITTTSRAVLISQSPSTELLVRRPEGSVQFAPGTLQMPSLTGKGTTQVDLILLGADKPGCVWFGKVDVPDPPDGVGAIAVTTEGKPLPGKGDCIVVPAKKTLTISIEATPEGRASGAVLGNIQVFERAGGQTKPTTTQIPFSFDLAIGVDEARRLLLAFLLLVIGLGLPMVILLIVNAATARFQTLEAVRGTAVPVIVSGRSMSRTDGKYPRPLALKDEDFESMASAGSHRSFTFGGVVFRAKASPNPFGGTIALAAPEGGAEKLKGGAGSRVELDPALAGSWVFLLDSDKTRRLPRGDAEGLLIAFIAEGDVNTQTNRMMPDIADRLPATADRLAGLVRGTKRKPATKKKARSGRAGAPGAEAAEDLPVDDVTAEPAAPEAPPGDRVADADAAGERTAETEAEPRVERETTTEAEAGATADRDDATPPPAAPTGFGGTAHIDPGSSSAAAPDDPDDGPGAPPIGFSGGRPD